MTWIHFQNLDTSEFEIILQHKMIIFPVKLVNFEDIYFLLQKISNQKILLLLGYTRDLKIPQYSII